MAGKSPAQPSNDDAGGRHYTLSAAEELSTEITLSVADVLDCPVEELPPLSDVVDVDALDSLFVSSEHHARVEFEYAGCVVTVSGGTDLSIVPPDGPDTAS